MPPAPAASAAAAAATMSGSCPPRELRSTATLLTLTLRTVMPASLPARTGRRKCVLRPIPRECFTHNPRMLPARLTAFALLVAALMAPVVASASTVPGAPLMKQYGVEDTQTAPGHLAIASAPDGTLLV